MDTLTIVSHNAFWFQGVPFPTDQPGPADARILDALTMRYRALHPDVLCLQEVQDAETCALVAERIGMEGHYCPGMTFPQYGGAVFWREGTLLADARSAPLPPQRMWQIVAVPFGDGAIRIANVHLPSGRQAGPERAARQRVAELRHLLAHAGEPAVLVGDFNEPPDGDICASMRKRGYLDAAVLCGHAHEPTSVGGRRVDYVWVHASFRAHVMQYAVMTRDACAAHLPGKTFLSDHLPVQIILRVRRSA